MFRHSAEGSVLAIRVHIIAGQQAEIRITAATCLPVAPSLDESLSIPYSCEIEMARRSFHAVGGEFALLSAGADAKSGGQGCRWPEKEGLRVLALGQGFVASHKILEFLRRF